ncbi:MAG: BadF/BadG/BcrA/BcrD ATPase family protein [Bacteroidota bacterium]
MSSPLFVGLDAGGTKTAVLAATDGEPVRLRGPGAQILRDDPEAVADTLAGLVEEARTSLGATDLGGVAVGIAGGGRTETRQSLAAALRSRLGGAEVAVTHDAEIARAAAWGDTSGALLLVGTGSLVYARTEAGETLRAGGWGARLGDDGSGTALGRAALRAVLAAYDGGPPTALAEIAAQDFDLPNADAVIEAVYGARRNVAAFAPLLLAGVDTDDWVAGSILTRETNALGQQAGWLATRAGDDIARRLAYTGGLAGEAVYTAALEAALERHLPGWAISRSEAEPVEGALALARRLGAATEAT